jgi:SAM-dependent methyltransferase
MPDDVPAFPGRFREVARYYSRGRPTYPPLLARRVAERVGGLAEARLLDLGTGPGFLAIDFAPYAREVIGIDPEPAMLAAAVINAERASAGVRFLEGNSATLDDSLGCFRLVTIGRAFHWMDRPGVLRRLDGLIEHGGAVALFGESYPDVPENAWRRPFREIIDRYAVHDPAAEILRASKDHDTVLLGSPFAHIERITVVERRRTSLDRFVDRALSFARAWGGQIDAPPEWLAEDVRSVLTPLATAGAIDEVIEGRATIAFRPSELDAGLGSPLGL